MAKNRSEQPTCEWGNVNSPETYRLLTEARGYFLLPGVIRKRHWVFALELANKEAEVKK